MNDPAENDVAEEILATLPQSEICTDSKAVTADDEAYDTLMPDHELQKTAALYLLTLKEKHKVTQTAIDFVVSQTKLFVNKMMEGLSSAVRKELNAPHHDATSVLSVLEDIRNPFEGLESQHLQLKYFQEHFGLIVSMY